jgi:diketogulonate reductase-like aldo/keto reductase
LRTDYIDILHLHEVSDLDIDDELLKLLEQLRDSGLIRYIGFASTYNRLKEISVARRSFPDVLQYSWSVLDFELAELEPLGPRIFHRSLLHAYSHIQNRLLDDKALRLGLVDKLNVDLLQPNVLANVLVACALYRNRGGLVLVGTRNDARVVQNFRGPQAPEIRAAASILMNDLSTLTHLTTLC